MDGDGVGGVGVEAPTDHGDACRGGPYQVEHTDGAGVLHRDPLTAEDGAPAPSDVHRCDAHDVQSVACREHT